MPTTIAQIDNDATIYRNATFQREYQWLDNTTPVDITTASGECKFRQRFSDPAPTFTATVTITDGPNGKFMVELTNVQTASFAPTSYSTGDTFVNLFFDVHITLTGVRYAVVRGTARFYDQATY